MCRRAPEAVSVRRVAREVVVVTQPQWCYYWSWRGIVVGGMSAYAVIAAVLGEAVAITRRDMSALYRRGLQVKVSLRLAFLPMRIQS